MKPNPAPVAASTRKRFIDFFNKDNTDDGLGTAFYGGLWKILRGSFKILNLQANTNEDPNSYPMATVTMPTTEVDINLLDIQNGSAASLWVTDSGNWFAVGVDQHPIDCNCDTGTECNRWNASNITGWTTVETGGRNRYEEATGQYCQTNVSGGGTPIYGVTGYYTDLYCTGASPNGICLGYAYNRNAVYGVVGYNALNYTTTCNTNYSTRYNAPNYSSYINGYNAETCNRWNEFTFNCETCYPQWIRIIQSVAGTITSTTQYLISEAIEQVASPFGSLTLYIQNSPVTKFVRSMTVRVREDQIKVEPYAEPNVTDKIELQNGEIIYTPTGANIDTNYGIMIVPSEYDQQTFVGGIQIDRADTSGI